MVGRWRARQARVIDHQGDRIGRAQEWGGMLLCVGFQGEWSPPYQRASCIIGNAEGGDG